MKKGTSIAELRPDLAAQFDLEFNFPLTPENMSVYSHRKIGWICDAKHKWINDPQHRMRSKHADCPYCTGRIVTPRVNDLFTLCPHLKQEWNYNRNIDIDPHTLHRSSNKRVWWKCDKGHEWETTISHRTDRKNATDCPFCTKQKVIPGVNDLASQRPDIAEEWNYAANAPLLPTQVMVKSGKRVHWQCKEGHQWQTAISHRTTGEKPTNCPYCDGRRAIPGETDLVTLYPGLMQQWDYEMNKDLDPTLLRPHSNKKAVWICEEGHRWEAVINSRTGKKGRGCPYCYGRFPIPGKTDLATQFPRIAKQWDSENNDLKTPSTVSSGSNYKATWICNFGHRWKATIASRTCGGNNCPVCNGRKPKVGKSDLRTLRPDLVLDWDTDGNGEFQPEDFTFKSQYIAAWKCHKCGTKWSKAIGARVSGNKCPHCYRGRFRRQSK